MKRLYEIQDYLYPYRVEWMDRKVKRLRAGYRLTGKELLPLLGVLAGEEYQRQAQDAGRMAARLDISYRLDHRMSGKREFLIAITGRPDGLAHRKEAHPWFPQSLYQGIEEDIRQLQAAAEQRFGTTEQERESLSLMVEQDYLMLTKVALNSLESEIREMLRRYPLRLAEDFRFVYGEQMDGGRCAMWPMEVR